MYFPALIIATTLTVAAGQYNGPLPPRPLAVPGAIPAGGARARGPSPVALPPRRIVGGRGRGVAAAAPIPAIRGRAPALALPPRPVVEQEEDLVQTTLPPPTYQPTTFQPPVFRPSIPPVDLPAPSRQQYSSSQEDNATYRPRPSSGEEETSRQDFPEEQAFSKDESFSRSRASQEDQGFTRSRPTQSQETSSYQRPSRPSVSDVQPAYQQRVRTSSQEQTYQQQRPRLPQVQEEQNLVRGRTEPKSAYNRAQVIQARPKIQGQSESAPASRQKKPTAQVISKYRDDNADGSITWGFENDDGTFKEETIGTDCVTRGKYGYFDPDGVKREYTYTSGIPCEKKDQDSIVGATNEGYIDYTNNKYIMPNGQEVALDGMVKNRARRPVYRN